MREREEESVDVLRLLLGVATGRLELGLRGGETVLSLHLFDSGSWSRVGLKGPGEVGRPSPFLSDVKGLKGLSDCLPLTRRMLCLEKDVLEILGSRGLLLREDTLAGGRLSRNSLSSLPIRPSLFSLCRKTENI